MSVWKRSMNVNINYIVEFTIQAFVDMNEKKGNQE